MQQEKLLVKLKAQTEVEFIIRQNLLLISQELFLHFHILLQTDGVNDLLITVHVLQAPALPTEVLMIQLTRFWTKQVLFFIQSALVRSFTILTIPLSEKPANILMILITL